jgi:hypothetical protein
MVRLLAVLLLLAALFVLFRFAMELRYAKGQRERARRAEEARGRRVLAEVPLSDAEIVFLTDDERVLAWGSHEVSKDRIAGARLLVNGAVLQEHAGRAGALPSPAAPAAYEGRERWEVRLFLDGGAEATIPCGALREGVSREIAGRVFAAVREEIEKRRGGA